MPFARRAGHDGIGSLKLDRLILGPTLGGRGFGVIAASDGVTLPAMARSAIEDFNLRIGDYVSRDRDIHAFFQVSRPPARELWFISTTAVHGFERGNLVWISWGALLDREQLEALEGRAYVLLGRLKLARRPKLGEVVPPVEASPGENDPAGGVAAPTLAQLETYAPTVGRELIVAEARRPITAVATLAKLLEGARVEQRIATSYVTAPAPIRTWGLVVYDVEDWEADDMWRPAPGREIVVGLAGVSGGRPPNRIDTVWHRFLQAMERGGSFGESVASAASRFATSTPDEAELRTEVAIERRLTSMMTACLGEAGADEALKYMHFLLRAASMIGDPDIRREAASATLGVFGAMIARVSRRGQWISMLVGLDEKTRMDLGVPAMLAARLSAEHGIVFDLPPSVLQQIGGDAVTVFRALLMRHVIAEPGQLTTDAMLLDLSLESLVAAESPADAWTLGRRLWSRLLCDLTADGADHAEKLRVAATKLVRRFVELLSKKERTTELAEILELRDYRRLQYLLGPKETRNLDEDITKIARDHLAIAQRRVDACIHEGGLGEARNVLGREFAFAVVALWGRNK